MDNKALAEQLVEKCLAKGADAAEVYIESSRQLSVAIRNGDVETIEEASASGVGIRVFLGGRIAFSHCNDMSDAALDRALSSAMAFARTTTADPSNVLPADGRVPAIDGLYRPLHRQDTDGREDRPRQSCSGDFACRPARRWKRPGHPRPAVMPQSRGLPASASTAPTRSSSASTAGRARTGTSARGGGSPGVRCPG